MQRSIFPLAVGENSDAVQGSGQKVLCDWEVEQRLCLSRGQKNDLLLHQIDLEFGILRHARVGSYVAPVLISVCRCRLSKFCQQRPGRARLLP